MERFLNANEIECRVGHVSKNGITLLLYIDARSAMKRLDELYGVYGWKREHVCVKDKEYCILSVKNPDNGEWISRMDCGTPSLSEKEKGETSDSFKRACVNWGIGRELYTAKFIFVSCETELDPKDSSKRRYIQKGFNKYNVKKIEYDQDGNILELEIVDSKKNLVYSLNSPIINSKKNDNSEKNKVLLKEINEMILDACNNDEEKAKRLLYSKTKNEKRKGYKDIKQIPESEIADVYNIITELYTNFKMSQNNIAPN